ncbi:MAG TPA: hypothetical protein VNY73_03565 [Bacteroidia bacterium]|jgi:hypothetical protein|nr:hypothetical protein [Bacteroidia bacterium]
MNKKLTIFVMLMISAITILSQTKTIPNSFSFLNNKNPDKEAFYKKSIEAADMEQYRLRTKRVRLTFDNGFEIELLSAKELFLKDPGININNYEMVLSPGTEPPVFTVLTSGHLTARVFSASKK